MSIKAKDNVNVEIERLNKDSYVYKLLSTQYYHVKNIFATKESIKKYTSKWIDMLKCLNNDLNRITFEYIKNISIEKVIYLTKRIINSNGDIYSLYYLFKDVSDEWSNIKERRYILRYIGSKKERNKIYTKNKYRLKPKQDKILGACKSCFENLFIHLLYTGITIKDVSSIKIEHIYNYRRKKVNKHGYTVEKYGKIKCFSISSSILKYLSIYLDNKHRVRTEFAYLFYDTRDTRYHLRSQYFYDAFKNIMNRVDDRIAIYMSLLTYEDIVEYPIIFDINLIFQ